RCSAHSDPQGLVHERPCRRHLDPHSGLPPSVPRLARRRRDEGRVALVTPELRTLLAGQVERVKALERELPTDSVQRYIPYLFPHRRGPKQRKEAGGGSGALARSGASRNTTSGSAGRPRAGTPGSPAGSATTCGGRRSATW